MSQTPAERAREIVEAWIKDPATEAAVDSSDFVRLCTRITAALTIPANHIRTHEGKDVKVLGTLPMTADGCVIGIDTSEVTEPCKCCGTEMPQLGVYHPEFPGKRADLRCDYLFIGCTDRKMIQFYSTPEAAEAALTSIPHAFGPSSSNGSSGGKVGLLHFQVPMTRKPLRVVGVWGVTTGAGYAIRAWTLAQKKES